MTWEAALDSFRTQLSPWLDLIVKSTLILAAAALLVLALRRRSAAARHCIWLATYVGMLVLPILTFTLPSWTLDLGVMSSPADSARELAAFSPTFEANRLALGHLAEPVQQLAAAQEALIQPGFALPPAPPAAPTLALSPVVVEWFTLRKIWVAGLVLTLSPLVAGCWALWRLRRQARPAADARLLEAARSLALELGIHRPVQVLLSTGRCMPMTWGVFRPVLLLPRSAERWPPERLRSVLLHELAHVKRHDCLTQMLLHFVRALYWFHPLVWLTQARARLEQESACDDAVLSAGQDPQEYAAELLTVTAGLPSGFLAPLVGLAMGKSRSLERRLLAILDADRDRQPPRRALALSLAALAALLILLSPVQLSLSGPQRTAAATVLAVCDSAWSPADQDSLTKTLEEVRGKIRAMAVTKPEEKALLEGALKGMMEALGDPHSSYLPATDVRCPEAASLVGVGFLIETDGDGIQVFSPLPNSPARKAGINAGDRITAIDGRPVKGMALYDAINLVRGPAGSPIKFTIVPKGGAAREVTVVRALVTLPSVEGINRAANDSWNYLIDPANKIGYIRINQFHNSTAKEFEDAVNVLDGQGMKGLVLDLRFCPGGSLAGSVAVAQNLLKSGRIVSLKGKEGDSGEIIEATGRDILGDRPLVLLINEQTISAAEVLAGALKDNNRALIVGARSQGKGSVQTIVQLQNQEGALKLTTAQLCLPSGRMIQKAAGAKDWGIDPSDGFYIPLPAKAILALQRHIQQRSVLPSAGADLDAAANSDEIDTQLQGALKTLTTKLTKGGFEAVGRPVAEVASETSERARIEAERLKLQEKLKDLEMQLEALGGKDQKTER
jgi:carboxyl-terminal processing protease